jgi:RNA polymerase sigma-70 factor, ECF subfamily
MDDTWQIKLYSDIESYLRKIKVDPAIIQDIRQDVFLKAHQSIHTLKSEGKLLSWLKVIVYNTVIDHYRKQKNTFQLPDPHEEEYNEGNAYLLKCISHLIQTLPDEQKEVMEAIEINGISQTQFAKMHNLPLSTIKSRVQRARNKVNDTVKKSCFLRVDTYGNVTDYVPPKEII